MFSRINIFSIIMDHYKTFSYNDKGNVRALIALFFFIIPLIPSISIVYYKHSIAKDTINTTVSVLSIFVGLLLNLLVLIFDLVKNNDNPYFLKTVREAISNISFAIVVSILGIAFLLIGLADIKPLFLSDIVSTLSYYCIIQFFLTLVIILKKIYAVFLSEIKK